MSTTLLLLGEPFVRQALVAGAVLALLAGLLGPLVVGRGMAFAVHGTAELAFAGGAGALLVAGAGAVGWGALIGAVLVAVLFGALGLAQRERDALIGVILSFGLGLGVLFQALYEGRSANKFGLLVGQIVGVDVGDVLTLTVVGVVVLAVLAVIHRPLLFASLDPDTAAARGVPVRRLSIVFAVLLGVTVALGVQIVGALLVMCLLVTPAAAAGRLTASPWVATVLAVVFAEVAVLGGIVASLAPGLPVSPFVASIAFVIYVVCRVVGSRGSRRRRVTGERDGAGTGAGTGSGSGTGTGPDGQADGSTTILSR